MTLEERFASPGPKRMLALDGGGIRGALTLGFLERIEQLLRVRHQQPDLKLCDYFDLIGGTSTGAIIAGALAIGLDAAQIRQIYLELGGKIFGRNRWWKRLGGLFDPEPLRVELQKVFGDRTLGDPTIRTGLCIVTKRADTRSTWVFMNHPHGRYYDENCPILLRQAIRASTAAPIFFVPEKFDVGEGIIGAFVDGGVSMANNPALLLFLVATLQRYPFRWPMGEDQLLLVSVGTGLWKHRDDVDVVVNSRLWNWAREVPTMLMEDASWQNQLLLQYLSRSPTAWTIHREIGDLSGDLLTPEPALSYLRYNVWLTQNGLQEINMAHLADRAEALCDMSDAANRFDLAEIGAKSAEQQVRDEHFSHAFDLCR